MRIRFTLNKLLLTGLMLSGSIGCMYADRITANGTSYEITSDNEVSIYSVDSSKSVVVIPSTVYDDAGKEYTVTAMGDYSCYGRSSLTSITLPETLKTIGNFAFYACDYLSSIKLPEGLTHVDGYVFYGCYSLTSVELPSTLTELSTGMFGWCSNLTSFTIPSTVTKIDNFAFYATGLKNITIPSSVTDLGGGVFGYCDSLNSINVEEGHPTLTSVDGVVYSKDGKTLVAYPGGRSSCDVPEGVTEIGPYAFYYCVNITSMTLPESLKTIDSGAFFYVAYLESLKIPAGVDNIRPGAFANCSNMTGLEVDENNATYCSVDGALYSKDMTRVVVCPTGVCANYTFPSTVKTIGELAFYGCTFESAAIPAGVTTIEGYAFSNCRSMTTVDIPSTVTTIGEYAFGDCDYLVTVNCYAVEPPAIGEGTTTAFGVNTPLTTINIPKGSKSKYASAFCWKDYTGYLVEKFTPGEDFVEGLTEGKVMVKTNGTSIEILSPSDTNSVAVYTLDGKCVYRGTASVINLDNKGVYMVVVNNTAYKVTL